jgi:nitroreductase/NAD-dependent dihydropyrimidine dehydrogenase PreA subunit
MKIDNNKCKSCRICINVCPIKILAVNDQNETFFKPEKTHLCLECGHCMAVCSTQAITVNKLNYETDFILLPKKNQDFSIFFEMLNSRRSVRAFKSKPVEKEKIQQILEAVSKSPFGAKHDGVEINVITDLSEINKALPLMSKFYDNLEKWYKNPLMRLIIKHKIGIEGFNTIKNHLMPMVKMGHYNLKDYNAITRDAPVILIFHAKPDAEEHTEDAIIYNTIAMLSAHAMGLGATIIGLIGPAVNKFPDLKQIFRIPNENKVVTSLILGYPKYEYLYSIKRNRQKITWV